MKVVFLGTARGSLPALSALAGSSHELIGVVTRPDRPAGRGLRRQAPPVKASAEKLGVRVFQPERLHDPGFLAELRLLAPDLLAATAFGALIPPQVLALPPRGAINLHPSLLPRYRGAAPVAWALINGDLRTGASVHYLTSEVDAGDVLDARAVAILPGEDRDSLEKRLFELGAELLLAAVDALAAGAARAVPQDPAGVVRAPRLSKADSPLDWRLPAERIVNRVRGLNPWPGASTRLPLETGEREVKVIRARALERGEGAPGRIVSISGELVIGAGQGAVAIERLQCPGKSPLDAASFLRGCRVKLKGTAR